MVIIDTVYAGAATLTAVSGTMTAGSPGVGNTFTVLDDTGYPVSGRFVVVIDRGEDSEEKILITSRSGAVFTVGQRGFDGTSGQGHADQATCELAFDARALNLLVDHVDGNEASPHSGVLLDNAAHDIEVRHQFGSGLAFGVPATPATLAPGNPSAPGTGNNPAREDHNHGVLSASATTITGVNAEGTNQSVARSNHDHALAASVVGATQLASNAVTTAKILNEAVTAAKVTNGQDWTTFSPTWVNVTLGTGTQQNYGRYIKLFGFVCGVAGFQLGTSGNVTGNLGLILPSTAANPDTAGAWTNAQWFAAGRGVDGATLWASIGNISDGTGLDRATNFATGGSGPWDATFPFNWDVGDRFHCFFFYEEA